MNERTKDIILGIIAAIICAFYQAFVIMLCWNMTISPIFGTIKLSYWAAMGIQFFLDLIFVPYTIRLQKEESDNGPILQMISAIIIYSIFLGVSALVSLGI